MYLEGGVEFIQRSQNEFQEQVIQPHLWVVQQLSNSLHPAWFLHLVVAVEVAGEGLPVVKKTADTLL